MKFNVKQIRTEKGITQTELAEKSGISRITINKIENNMKKTVKSDTLVKLSSALGVSIADIFLP